MIFLSELIILMAIFILIILTGHAEGFLFILPIFLFAGFILKLLNKKIKKWALTRVEVAQILQPNTENFYRVRIYSFK